MPLISRVPTAKAWRNRVQIHDLCVTGIKISEQVLKQKISKQTCYLILQESPMSKALSSHNASYRATYRTTSQLFLQLSQHQLVSYNSVMTLTTTG
jgi:hypothetical protein